MDSNNLDGIVFTLSNLFLGRGEGENINLANFANYNNFITIVFNNLHAFRNLFYILKKTYRYTGFCNRMCLQYLSPGLAITVRGSTVTDTTCNSC